MKYILLFLSILFATLIVLGLQAPFTYTYKGVTAVSIEQATRIIQDKSETKDIAVFAYNNKQDQVYLAYNFKGNQNDAALYGVPTGTPDNKVDFIVILAILGTLGIIGLTIDCWMRPHKYS